MTEERERLIRDQALRLIAVWPPIGRPERREEYLGALLRDVRLEACDVRSGVDRLIHDFADTVYPPNPGDVVGMAHLARDERRREDASEREPVGPWTIAQVGNGCPHCRHEGQQPEDRIRDRVWVGGPKIVRCIEHNLGWQGRLPAERDPGEDGYVEAHEIREMVARLVTEKVVS